MTWFERHLGMDGVDLTVHAALTIVGMVIVNQAFGGLLADVFTTKVLGISLVVFAWRRHRGRKRLSQERETGLTTGQMAADRLADVEARLAELEGAQERLAELEERVDFAERMLASQTGAGVGSPPGAALPAPNDRRT
jgi:hypothetical protein